jgi:diguanylate cyclase (GGDEF)-like protein
LRDLVPPDHRDRLCEAHRHALLIPDESSEVEHLLISADGAAGWFETHFRAVVDAEHGVQGTVAVIRDIADHKRREADLTRVAMTDPLTGLPNRRAFFRAVEDLVERGQSAAVALIDIDHFKRVNDRFGHLVGDEVLIAFAAMARSSLTAGDQLARIGGEEFALLMPGKSTAAAQGICVRLGARIAGNNIETAAGSVEVTISAGIAQLHGEADGALAAADAALYRAKAQGRARHAIAA